MHTRVLTSFVFFFAAAVVRSEVSVVSKVNISYGISGLSWKSAAFKYYGPQSGSALNGTAVLIDVICDSKKWPNVEGKIAIFTRASRGCSLDKVYKGLSKEKAIATVETGIQELPDMYSYLHASWDRCLLCHNPMPYFRVVDPNDEMRDHLVRFVDSGAMLHIESPHSVSLTNLYGSWLWLLMMRILVPMYAILTAIMAAFEVYREVFSVDFKARAPHSVRLVICVVESTSLLVVGCMLALGQYGPMVLPWPIHFALVTLFSGVGLFTTTLLAIFLYEEGRHSSEGRQAPRRSIWKAHRALISMAFICFVCWDLIFVIFFISP